VITVDIGCKTEYGVEEHVIKVAGVSESRDVRYLVSAHICTCTQYSPEAVVARCGEDCIACGSSHRSVGSGGATNGNWGGWLMFGIIDLHERVSVQEGCKERTGTRSGTW